MFLPKNDILEWKKNIFKNQMIFDIGGIQAYAKKNEIG